MSRLQIVAVATILLVATAPLLSQNTPSDRAGGPEQILLQLGPTHARVQLLAENSALTSGRTNVVGLRFELEDGWHIYWQNPGDSGAPPKVVWNLSRGLAAGPLVFPAPQRIRTPTGVNYGYEHEVLLMAPLKVAAATAGDARLSAVVRYIVCRDVCVPGTAKLSLRIPVGVGAASSSRQQFDRAREQVPQAAPRTWSAAARLDRGDLVLTVITGRREDRLDVFPVDVGIVNDGVAPVYEATEHGVVIRFKRADPTGKTPPRLSFVIERPNSRPVLVVARVARSAGG